MPGAIKLQFFRVFGGGASPVWTLFLIQRTLAVKIVKMNYLYELHLILGHIRQKKHQS